MLGNVLEWCEDIYSKDAYGKHQSNNPINREGGSCRVFRGGSWCYGPGSVRCANRIFDSFDEFWYEDLGFRLLRTP